MAEHVEVLLEGGHRVFRAACGKWLEDVGFLARKLEDVVESRNCRKERLFDVIYYTSTSEPK